MIRTAPGRLRSTGVVVAARRSVWDRSRIGSDGMKSDVVVLVCAISAGVHAALAPEHFTHSAATGIGFAAAAILLAPLALLLARDPTNRPALIAAAVVLAGLLVAYVFAITTGVPLFLPDPEPVELVAVVTKVVELVGLVAAVSLLASPRAGTAEAAAARRVPLTVLAFVALFSAFVALELSGDHGHDGGHDEHAAKGVGRRAGSPAATPVPTWAER
jgi:hypothetical protein